MGRVREWLARRQASRGREALDVWAGERPLTERPQEDPPVDEDLPALPDKEDWTSERAESVPPWRRHDRELIDAARRAAAASGARDAEPAPELVRDLRRLADLHADAAVSDGEFVAGVRARLAAEP